MLSRVRVRGFGLVIMILLLVRNVMILLLDV